MPSSVYRRTSRQVPFPAVPHAHHLLRPCASTGTRDHRLRHGLKPGNRPAALRRSQPERASLPHRARRAEFEAALAEDHAVPQLQAQLARNADREQRDGADQGVG